MGAMTVREQLRDAYLSSGRTMDDLSHASGVSKRTILHMFCGRNVTTANLFALACVLRIESIRVPVSEQLS